MKINKVRYFFAIILIILGTTGCGINSNIMFKIPKNSTFKYDSIPMRPEQDYCISKDDKIKIYVSSNYGQNIINQMSGIADANNMETSINYVDIEYLVNSDGAVDLPIIGNLKIEGLTIDKLEDTLSTLYSTIGGYKNPFTKVEVTNKRVIVFPGDGGDAKVVPILNNNTTLMEALAFTGGISLRGKAKAVKLMRKVADKREVYLIDLSTIEGLKYADIVVQSNDYIYVEPHERLGREFLSQVIPYLSIISSLVILISIIPK